MSFHHGEGHMVTFSRSIGQNLGQGQRMRMRFFRQKDFFLHVYSLYILVTLLPQRQGGAMIHKFDRGLPYDNIHNPFKFHKPYDCY